MKRGGSWYRFTEREREREREKFEIVSRKMDDLRKCSSMKGPVECSDNRNPYSIPLPISAHHLSAAQCPCICPKCPITYTRVLPVKASSPLSIT